MRQICVKNASKMRGTPLGRTPFGRIPNLQKAPSPCVSGCCGLVCGSPCGPPSLMWGPKTWPWLARKVTEILPSRQRIPSGTLGLHFINECSRNPIRANRSQVMKIVGSGQEVCFCPSRPDPGRNAREQDGTRTGRDGPHLGIWMGPKHCKTRHMANLDGTTSDPGWDLDGPRIGPRRGSGWHSSETVTDF